MEKKIDEELFEKVYNQYMHREINKTKFAEAIGVSRPTLDKVLKKRGL